MHVLFVDGIVSSGVGVRPSARVVDCRRNPRLKEGSD